MELLPDVGARQHRIRAFGHDLLRTPADPGAHICEPFFWGSYVMAPWCNRTAARPVAIDGVTVDVPANFRDGTAIHGQVYASRWSVDSRSDQTIELSLTHGADGWPWRYDAGMKVTVAGTQLSVGLQLVNRSEGRMPAGIGLHPWFIGRPEVAINADAVFDANTDSPPRPRTASGPLDRRRLERMPVGLDATWTGVRDPAVRLRWPDLGVEADMRVEAPTTYVCAASPADIDAIAVEPQTHGPDGLRRLVNSEPAALALLDPGAQLAMAITLSLKPTEETGSEQ